MNLMEIMANNDPQFRARLSKIEGERERTQFYAEIAVIRDRENRRANSLYGKLYKFVSHAYSMYKKEEY